MGSSNWFGNLQLAYKYIVVFLSLLALTFIAGLIKVLFDRKKLKKMAAKEELEAGAKEDQVELNQREKDEGDLFGIRAIEAGFYAGVHQSRPTSRAGSVIDHPAMSSSTLGGGVNSPLMKGHSDNASVNSLNIGNYDSQKRKSPPGIKLRPSQAELTGRHGAADMSLRVPTSPGIPRGQQSPTFGSDSGSEGHTTRRSMSPRQSDFNPSHYSPAPQIAMPDALQVTYHASDDSFAKSQAASFNSTPGQSPTPPSPGNPPFARLPTLPSSALRKESRSPSPEFYTPSERPGQSTTKPAQSSIAQLPAIATGDQHKRDGSETSSMYSQARLSTFDAYQAYQKQTDRFPNVTKAGSSANNSYPSTDESRGTSIVMLAEGERQPSDTPAPSSLLAPGQGKESRLSEFYDVYYRNSVVPSQATDNTKRTYIGRQSTIMEVDTPLASPAFPKSKARQAGVAF